MHQFIFATKFRGLITWPDIQLVHNYTPIDLKDRISGRTPHTPAFLNNGTSMLSHNMFSTPFQLHRPVTDKATKIKRDKPYILNFDLHAQFYHPLVKRVSVILVGKLDVTGTLFTMASWSPPKLGSMKECPSSSAWMGLFILWRK